MARVKYKLHNYREAEQHILEAIAAKPDEFRFYEALFFARDAGGKNEAAQKALKIFVDRYFDEPCFAYVRISEQFALDGKYNKAAMYADRAREALADYPNRRKTGDLKLAEAYGAVGLRATKPKEVVPTLKKAIATKKPVLMDFHVSREELVYPMVPAGASLTEMILL